MCLSALIVGLVVRLPLRPVGSRRPVRSEPRTRTVCIRSRLFFVRKTICVLTSCPDSACSLAGSRSSVSPSTSPRSRKRPRLDHGLFDLRGGGVDGSLDGRHLHRGTRTSIQSGIAGSVGSVSGIPATVPADGRRWPESRPVSRRLRPFRSRSPLRWRRPCLRGRLSGRLALRGGL